MDIRTTAVNTARKAGDLLKSGLGKAGKLEAKGTADIVTEMDRRAEGLIIADIGAAFPDHCILAEESGALTGDPRFRWIIDPLDGTTNYVHGFPYFSVSIAFEKDGEVILGVVYAPMLNEILTAEKDIGARINGKPIRVSGTERLDKSLLATDFPHDPEAFEVYSRLFSAFCLRSGSVRRMGSAALDLCGVACGKLDGFWNPGLRPWDVAAAILIVKEAGGSATDYAGRPFSLDSSRCVASNGLIHAEMVEVIGHD